MESLQWITLFIQLIYVTNVNGKCDTFTTDKVTSVRNRYGYQKNLHELVCERIEINTVAFAEYNIQHLIAIISIRESNTKLINPGTFHSMYYLEEMYITQSDILEITKGLFIGFKFLTILDLSANNISKIQLNSFSGVSSLKVLNISRNNLQSINFLGDGFKYNITKLDLSRNKISNITDKFAVLTELRKLDLSDNLINNFDEDTFANLNQLVSLSLAGNQITKLPVGTFKDMHSLTFMNLSNNKINFLALGTFAGLSSLDTIDLGFNEIKSFSEDILHDLHTVTAFRINNNYISDLNADALLGNLPVLWYISLDRNNWTCSKLSEIIRNLHTKQITLPLGGSFTKKNINGIACSGESDGKVTKQTVNVNGNQNFEVSLENLKRYFASDFKQSEFYRYFNNKLPKEIEDNFKDSRLFKHVDDNFLNSKFYKYFTEDFINSTFFEYLDKKIETLKISRNLDNIPLNKSDYTELLKNTISEYFDSLKPNNDYLRDVDAEERDNNTMLKTQNKLMIVLIFIMVMIWLTLLCRYWKINKTKEFVVNFSKFRQTRKVVQNTEDQLL